ncbi:MAG TPA: amidohydrolase family protein, partial [Xanthomonadales bacterium]|nr:amidohydrolase family protein [Xanthomonadales bacterium]
MSAITRFVLCALLASAVCLGAASASAADFDLVIHNGRVMNPANGLDSVRDVGIRDGRIAELSRESLSGRDEVDAAGLVVAPGFIDLHAHGQGPFEAWLQAQDGVTTQLEMEVGVFPVDAWYAGRAGTAPINYGATVGHIAVRIATMEDLAALGFEERDLAAGLANSPHFPKIAAQTRWAQEPAEEGEIDAMQRRLQQGLDQGALGIGFGINYTAGATREEIFRMFSVAAANG